MDYIQYGSGYQQKFIPDYAKEYSKPEEDTKGWNTQIERIYKPEIQARRMHESWKSMGPRITTDSYPRNQFMDPKFQKEKDKKTPKEGHPTLQKKSSVEELTDRLKNMKIAYVWDDMITCYGCGEKGHRRNNCPQNQVNTVNEEDEEEEMEEEEDEGISYTEEQAELINTLLA